MLLKAINLDSYIKIKKSQAILLKKFPLFIKNADNEFVLYKSEKMKLKDDVLSKDNFPDFFIRNEDKQKVIGEIQNRLNRRLYKQIRSKGLIKTKKIILEIVNEAISNPTEDSVNRLPETIELLCKGYANNNALLKKLTEISGQNDSTIEHITNVMIFTMNYCLFCNYADSDIHRLSTGALLHDIGKSQLPKKICNADHSLSEKEFKLYKTHTILGHDIIKQNKDLDNSLAVGVLEHHERIDGSGYPKGVVQISFEGQLFGIINSFEQLVYREKSYRKAKKPFDAMSIIKDEVLNEGKFSKTIFSDLCRSLGD